jgi:hypothetical protein
MFWLIIVLLVRPRPHPRVRLVQSKAQRRVVEPSPPRSQPLRASLVTILPGTFDEALLRFDLARPRPQVGLRESCESILLHYSHIGG